MPSARLDPRIGRTKAHVLAIARELLAEGGPAGLTYTALAARSAVTRQTIYRHWPSREKLLADVILTGPDVGYPTPGPNARAVIIEFLTSLRAGLSNGPTSAALLAIAAQADQDSGSADALAHVVADRQAALNILLVDTDVVLDAEDYAQVAGPVIVQLLIARAEVTDGLIAKTVDAWLQQRLARTSQP